MVLGLILALTASLDAVSVTVDYTTAGGAGTAPTYDGNGAMTSDGTYGNRAFTYDALGRLTGVTGPGVTATYALDGAGNRWAETLNGVTTAFDLDLATANPTILADGTRRYLPGDPAAGYDEAGVWYSGLVDQHGSVLGTVSETGVLSALRTYDPYGAARPGSGDPGGVGFTGEWRNGTGLVHLGARDYDPVLARFISRDSFGGLAMAPQTANRYAFGAGNPLTAADPSGHFNNHLIMPVRSFVAMGVSALGPVGLGYATLSGILGYDPIAGVSLSPEERALYLAPAAIGVVAVVAAKVARLAPRLVNATVGRPTMPWPSGGRRRAGLPPSRARSRAVSAGRASRSRPSAHGWEGVSGRRSGSSGERQSLGASSSGAWALRPQRISAARHVAMCSADS
jgi:RHS repeat-associated protein